MRWQGRRGSSNIVNRRGLGAGALGGGGIVVAILYFLFTGDPSAIIDQQQDQVGASGSRTTAADDAQSQFVGVVLADTEDVWNKVFADAGRSYVEPKLVLFSGRVSSACGTASAAVGPFYCPRDQQVYIDLDFFASLQSQLGAGGDFAQAYVVAHEIGHHVQNLLGIMSEGGRDNKASVAIELQADCFAGIWAKRTEQEKHVLEAGDLDEAIGAAEAVGDDRLQKRGQGYVVPDSFTHGTSAQRVAAFKRGFSNGRMRDCESAL